MNDNVRLIDLTMGQFKERLFAMLDEWQSQRTAALAEADDDRFVYGLKGIQELFNVSKKLACQYKATFLKEAVSQRGRKIVVDKKKARELFDLQKRTSAV